MGSKRKEQDPGLEVETTLAKISGIVTRQVDLLDREQGLLESEHVTNLSRLATVMLSMRKDDRDAARAIAADEASIDAMSLGEIEAAIDDLRQVQALKRGALK